MTRSPRALPARRGCAQTVSVLCALGNRAVSIGRPTGAQGREHGLLLKRVLPCRSRAVFAGGPTSSLSCAPVLPAGAQYTAVTHRKQAPSTQSPWGTQDSLAPRCTGKASPVSLGSPGFQSLRAPVPTCGSAAPHDPGCFPGFLRDALLRTQPLGGGLLLRQPTCGALRHLCS